MTRSARMIAFYFQLALAIHFGFHLTISYGQSSSTLITQDSILTGNALEARIRDSIKSELWDRLNTGPDGNLIGDQRSLSLSIYDNNSKLHIDFGLRTSVIPAISEGQHHRVFSYSVKVNLPSDSTQKSTPLPTLDGLRDAYTIGVNFNFSDIPVNIEAFKFFSRNPISWTETTEQMAYRFLDNSPISATCRRLFVQNVLRNGPYENYLNLLHRDQGGWQRVNELTGLDLWVAIQYTVENVSSEGLSANQQLALNALRTLVNDLASAINVDTTLIEMCAPDLYEQHIQKYVQGTWTADSWSRSFGIDARIGRDKHDYFSKDTLISQEDGLRVYSFSIFGTFFRAAHRGAQNITLSYSYKKAYEPQEKSIRCLQVITNPENDCHAAVFGAPSEFKQNILSFDWRSRLEDFLGNHPIAYHVKGTYDFEDHNYGVEIPIYLFSFGGEDLNAGVRLGWQSETTEAGIGFFFGQKF